MRSAPRCLVCLSQIVGFVIVAALMPIGAHSQILTGAQYEAAETDTYVQMNAGACCTGEYHSLTNVYIGQSFIATGGNPSTITLGLVNNLPSDVPPANPKFRLLITELPPSGFQPGAVLWESAQQTITSTNWMEYSYPIAGVTLEIGRRYAWVLDTFTDRDGAQDAMGFYFNLGTGQGAPIYTKGAAWFQNAFGGGRASDFSQPWTFGGGGSMSFLMTYKAPFFEGFFAPVENVPALNTRKAGAAVPIKFSLGADRGLDILTPGAPSSFQVSCDSYASSSSDQDALTSSSSSLQYDSTAGQYVYVWKTQKEWANTCRQFDLRLRDGNRQSAIFRFAR